MDRLTVRQKFILKNLMEKGPLTIKGLSLQIEVSERTILRETSALNDWLKEYRLRISESGGSLQIHGQETDLEKVRVLLEEIPHLWMLNQEQRQVLITAQLLLADEPIKSAYFSHQFNVVEGTIGFCLDKIESDLKEKSLILVRKRGYGIEITGTDWNKRNAFVDLLYQYKSLNELLAFLFEENRDFQLQAFFKVTFSDDLIKRAKKLLEKIDERKLLRNDTGFFSAFIHLLLVIKRTESHCPLELPEQLVQEVFSAKEFSFVEEIQGILQECGIEVPASELAYLAIHLHGGRTLFQEENFSKGLGSDLGELIREVIYIVGKRLNTKIKCDDQLESGLIQHINPALYRLRMGLEVRNPIINEIKQFYQKLYGAVDYACKLVFSKYNLIIPANEVGYITMHIGAALERQHRVEKKLRTLVICPNGLSTANMLCSKLSQTFPELSPIDVCSLREMNEKLQDAYNLVVSTVPVDKKGENDPVMVISPLLPNRDLEEIRAMIQAKLSKGSFSKKGPLLLNNEEKEEAGEDFEVLNNVLKNFQLNKLTSRHYQDIIGEIAREIHSTGLIEDQAKIRNLIEKREEIGSVIIPGLHIALIHFRTEEIAAPFLGAYRLEQFTRMKGAGFSSEDVDTFFVMLARKKESNYILELLGRISVALAENRTFAEILRFGDLTDIRNELVEILNREEDQ